VAKVIFTVGYEIPESQRHRYLELARQLKPLLNVHGTSYTVCELENKRNNFQEVYVYPSAEAYEAADDIENAEAEALIEQIYELAKNRKISYSAAVEIV
jgi:hypothetical protein